MEHMLYPTSSFKTDPDEKGTESYATLPILPTQISGFKTDPDEKGTESGIHTPLLHEVIEFQD